MNISFGHLIKNCKTKQKFSLARIAKENFKSLMNDSNSVILHVTEDKNTLDHQLKEIAIIDLQNNELFNRKFYLSVNL